MQQILVSQCAYKMQGFDGNSKQHFIGEPKRDKRVCRFCGKSKPEVSFTKKAHALSESIGNKLIINNEECDACNEFFSNIETDFYNFNAFPLSLCDVKGKNGSRKIKSRDIDLFNKNKILIFQPHNVDFPSKIEFDSNSIGSFNLPFSLDRSKYIPQNVYKSLVKYSLSTIPTEYLPFFKDTISWITDNEYFLDSLPKVILYSNNLQSHPRIANFIRVSQKDNFPYAFSIVEFATIGYCYIIPLAKGESNISLEQFFYFQHMFGQLNLGYSPMEINLSSKLLSTSKFNLEITNIIEGKTAFTLPYSDIKEIDIKSIMGVTED